MSSFDPPLYMILSLIIATVVAFKFLSSVKGQKRAQWRETFDVVGFPSGGAFRWTRALLHSLTSTRQNVLAGYERFSKGRRTPFAIPSIWTGDAMIVLPAEMLAVLRKPDNEVRSFKALTETLGLPYVISDSRVYTNTIHFDVVRKYMGESKDLDALAAVTADEIDAAFRDCWGVSEEWKSLNAWEDCGRIITRAATRILVGLPMCRNKKFEKQSRQFSEAVLAGSAIINCFPPCMRGLVGPLIGFRAKFYQSRCLKTLVPLVEERIRLWESSQKGDDIPVRQSAFIFVRKISCPDMTNK